MKVRALDDIQVRNVVLHCSKDNYALDASKIHFQNLHPSKDRCLAHRRLYCCYHIISVTQGVAKGTNSEVLGRGFST